MRLFLIAAFCLFSASIYGQAGAEYYPPVDEYRLDVRFLPESSSLTGIATVTFAEQSDYEQMATGFLHGELYVDSITVNGVPIQFKQGRTEYRYNYSRMATQFEFALSDLGAEHAVAIYYHGYMHESKAGSQSNYMRIDADGVYLRSYGYSLWFPVFLPERHSDMEVDFSNITIRTPADFYTVVVGEKTGERFEDGLRVTEWAAPEQSLFAVQCVSQRCLSTSEGAVALYHYADSASVENASRILAFANGLLERYARYYQPASDEVTYYIVEMPKYGDISSGNMTGLQKDVWCAFSEEDWAQRTLGHELVHQFVWVRPDVDDRFFALAVEGFPSYLHLPVIAELEGDEAYLSFMEGIEVNYLRRRETGLGWRGARLSAEKPILGITSDEVGTYKDSFVLNDRALLFFHYLYSRMGSERFFEFTRELFSEDDVTEKSFRGLIHAYLPDSDDDIRLWLETTEFPERLRLVR